jgi:cation:H+ antiporter
VKIQLLFSKYKTSLILSVIFLIPACIIQYRSTYPSIFLEIPIFVISLYILLRSASLFTGFATKLGSKIGLSKLATGILIISIGTSAPELFSSFAAVLENQPNMVIGNIFGTVIANTLLGIGCAAIFSKIPLGVHKDVFGTQMAIFFAAVVLSAACLYDGVLFYYEGAVLLVVLVCYLGYVVQAAPENSDKKIENKDDNPQKTEKENTLLIIILLLLNLFFLFLSGDFVVSSLIYGSKYMGVSNVKVASSLLAIGTSVPEIATAIALVRQNNPDSLFGEIIGSNIFDILGVLGAISLISPLTMSGNLLLFLSISMFAVFMLMHVIMNDRKINRLEGVVLVLLFCVFTMQLTAL